MLNVQMLLAQIFILDRRFLQLWFFLRLESFVDGSFWIEICGEVYIRCMFQISICFNFSPTPTKFYQFNHQPIPMFQPTLPSFHIWGKPNDFLQISFVYTFIFRFSSLIKDSLWGNISFLDDSTSTSLVESSIYYCGEAESETVMYSNSVLQGSSLEHIWKYKIAGKLWNARHSWNQFYILSVSGRTIVCECISLLLAFHVHIAVCTAQRWRDWLRLGLP